MLYRSKFVKDVLRSMGRLCVLMVFTTLSFVMSQSVVWAQTIDDNFEDDFFDEIDWEYIDMLDALDGVNESDILEDFDVEFDENTLETALSEWIIIADPDEFGAIRSIGMTIDRVDPLVGLGLAVARVQTQSNLTLEETKAAIIAVAPSAEIDLNHIYRPSVERGRKYKGMAPKTLIELPPNFTGKGRKIGVIDTAVNIDHPVFENAHVQMADFARSKYERPTDHGTAVLSILAGQSSDYVGLLPEAQYFAASVFFEPKEGGRRATTDSLVRAISWMKENNVSVINMSLTGPSNRVLKRAIEAAIQRNTIITAAVGNDGPNAPPLYPAAYEDVIGVTAISQKHKIYRLAGRGGHVDFSAPGVNLRHAVKSKAYGVSSGTSMAVPFVTAVIISKSTESQIFSDAFIENLKSAAEDLGAKGFDPIYGHGLIQIKNDKRLAEPTN